MGCRIATSNERRERVCQCYRHNKTRVNLIAWRRAKAQHKQLVKTHKGKSWMKLVEEMRCGAPSATIYDMIRKIKGKPQRKISILEENGTNYATIPDIANSLAQTFCETSSDDNYSNAFVSHKINQESKPINFTGDNAEPYNREFTTQDMQHNFDKAKNTSRGLD